MSPRRSPGRAGSSRSGGIGEEEAALRRRRGEGERAGPRPLVESRTDARRGEPVTVLLRSGHMLKVGRGFDEQTFARVVALLERG